MSLPIPIQESTIYHEAGHAAAFWCYGIPLRYVSIRPDLAHGYGGMAVTAVEPPDKGLPELEKWMRASAAGQVAKNHRCGIATPKTTDLITKFHRVIADMNDNPDRPGHHDMRNFAYLGLRRDTEIRETGTGVETGPEGWTLIWLDAEQLIRSKLWPAVQAIADELLTIANAHVGQDISTLPDLAGQEVVAIASEAMKDASPCNPATA
jgi:hypothetical protein